MQFWISLELSQETMWLDMSLSVIILYLTVKILVSCQPIKCSRAEIKFLF